MKLREKFFRFLGKSTANKYWLILIIVLAVTLIFGALAEKLRLDMTWLSMVPKSDSSVKEYNKIVKNFDSATPIIVTIEGENKKELLKTAEQLAKELKNLKIYIKDVRYKTEVKFIKKYGLFLLKSKDLKSYKKILQDFNLSKFIKHINDNMEREYIQEEEEPLAKQEKEAVQFLDTLKNSLTSFKLYLSNPLKNNNTIIDAAERFTIGDKYFLSRDKKMLLMIAIPKFPVTDMTRAIETARKTEAVLNNFRKKYPELKFGQTGMHIISRDEMDAGTHDTIFNLITAIIIVLALFIISFRMVSAPFLAMFSLLLGIIWNLGITYLIFGRLNIMTAMIGVILIGLGIDYSIHLISGFTQSYYKNSDYKTAFKETFLKVGPGILTGALTTAIAFLVFAIVKIDMLVEIGIVLGIGILCTFLSALFILPSLIMVKEKIKKIFIKKEKTHKVSMELNTLGLIGEKVTKIPVITIIIVLVITLLSIYFIPKLHFSGDFKKLEARGLISVELMDKIAEKFDMGTDAVSFTTSSLKETENLTDKLNKLSSVGFVDSLSVYLPSKEKQIKRRKYIREIKRILFNQPQLKTVNKEELIQELRRLEANIIELGDMSYISGLDKIVKRCDEIANLKNNKKAGENIFDKLIEEIKKSDLNKLTEMQNIFATRLKENFLQMCNAQQVTLKDIPEDIKNIYISKDKKSFLVSVYPSKNIWPDLMKSKFLEEVKSIVKNITGMPVFMYIVIKHAGEGGRWATILALILIFLVVLIDFRNLKFAVVSLLPLIIGSLWVLGFLVITDFQLTYMTIMIVPLIIGIGIDDGVHIIHRYRMEGKGSLPLVLRTTGKAIVLTSLTTMVAFGSLAFSKMVGYQQFGISLFAGIGFLLLLSVIFLPAILKLIEK